MLTVLDLFSGIGGFSLGLERTGGFKTIAFCEIDNYCQRVLKKHWPEVYIHSDIRTLSAAQWDHFGYRRPDVICGGFPCQPFSTGGKRRATGDDRYLWPEMLRVVRALRPRYVLGENVAGLAHQFDGVLEQICFDLETSDYSVLPPLMVPSAAFGALQRRDRIWILARSNESLHGPKQGEQQETRAKELDRGVTLHASTDGNGLDGAQVHQRSGAEGQRAPYAVRGNWWGAEPGVGRMVYGVSSEMDRSRIEHLGNAIDPNFAEWIGERILAAERGE